jgi:hypothetical protein
VIGNKTRPKQEQNKTKNKEVALNTKTVAIKTKSKNNTVAKININTQYVHNTHYSVGNLIIFKSTGGLHINSITKTKAKVGKVYRLETGGRPRLNTPQTECFQNKIK